MNRGWYILLEMFQVIFILQSAQLPTVHIAPNVLTNSVIHALLVIIRLITNVQVRVMINLFYDIVHNTLILEYTEYQFQ